MAKGAGATRLLGAPMPHSYEQYVSERQRLGTINNGLDYYNRKSGGFVIFEEGHLTPTRTNPEFQFAKELARLGYPVYLTPESAKKGGVSFRLGPTGNPTFPDARVGRYSLTYYEQRTPTSDNAKYGALTALQHASNKGVKLAAIYDKHGILTKESIQKGIDWYEHIRTTKTGNNLIHLKGVLVVNKRHEVYWHDMETSGIKWWE